MAARPATWTEEIASPDVHPSQARGANAAGNAVPRRHEQTVSDITLFVQPSLERELEAPENNTRSSALANR